MRRHPLVLFVNLCLILAFTACSMNPYIVFLSYAGSFVALIIFGGMAEIKGAFGRLIFFLVFLVSIQGLFSHNGMTALFYINSQPVTLESLWFGVVMAHLLLASVQWFLVFNRWLDSEHIMYLFGRISPKAALLFSMILRFIPLMKRRYRLILEAQRGMGYTGLSKVRGFLKACSVLSGWSLESSIETEDSMVSRGYGAARRTSFHRFRFHLRDGIYLFLMLFLGVVMFYIFYKKVFSVYFYPVFWIKNIGFYGIIGICVFLLLMVLHLLYIKW